MEIITLVEEYSFLHAPYIDLCGKDKERVRINIL